MPLILIPGGTSPQNLLSVEPDFPWVSGSDASKTLSFVVRGSASSYLPDINELRGAQDSDASAVAWSHAPATYDGLAKRSVASIDHLSDLESDTAFRIGIQYGELRDLSPTPKPTGTIEFSRQVVLEAVHVTHARELIETFPAILPNGVDSGGTAIGLDQDGNIEGGEEQVPRVRLRAELTLDSTALGDTAAQEQRLAGWEALVGTVNQAEWYGREAESVKLLGLDDVINYSNGSERHSFEFEVRENIDPANPITVFGIPNCHKKGWERFEPILANGPQGPVVRGVKVLSSHDVADWSNLP